MATYAWLIFGPHIPSSHSAFFDFENKFLELHFVYNLLNFGF